MTDKILALLFLIGVGYFFWFATVGAGRSLGKKVICPSCGKYGMHSCGTGYYLNGKRASDWKCPYCGRKFTRGGQ